MFKAHFRLFAKDIAGVFPSLFRLDVRHSALTIAPRCKVHGTFCDVVALIPSSFLGAL